MNGLAQITNWLPVLFVIIAGLVIIGVIVNVITILMKMTAKRRHEVLFGSFVLFLIVVIMVGGVMAMRDAMRDETIKACQNQGINYTIQQWENGEVNYTKCNISTVNGLL